MKKLLVGLMAFGLLSQVAAEPLFASVFDNARHGKKGIGYNKDDEFVLDLDSNHRPLEEDLSSDNRS